MSVLSEGRLKFDFTAAVAARQFDDASHGMSHCMKAVDFVVEGSNRLLFIEVKDPDNPDADDYSDRDKFIEGLKSGKVLGKLVGKYRDSFLYEWAMKRISKPITYVVVIACDALNEPDLLGLKHKLEHQLPIHGPAGEWPRPIVQQCLVMNLKMWKKHLSEFPVRRT